MQGVFKEKQPQSDAHENGESLGIDAGDYTSHPTVQRRRYMDPATAAATASPAAAAGARAAAAGGALPSAVVPSSVTNFVYAPMQRFTLEDKVYFIKPKSDTEPIQTQSGHWISRYTKEDKDTDFQPTAGGAPVKCKQGRAEDQTT
jgi:hypothetical protein